jgi:predicted protein tyrosine phosphatase
VSTKDDWPKEKNWKKVYTRSEKLGRAKQLGFDYPRVSEAQLKQRGAADAAAEKIHVLFICSRNQWRSPTAERMWRGHPQVMARSAGTSPNARHPVTAEDLRWAHLIIAMEQKHKARLVAEFTRLLENKPIHVLDIPDQYQFMDPELVAELDLCVGPLLGVERV